MYTIIFEQNEVYEFAAEELASCWAKINGDILHRYTKRPLNCLIPVYIGSPAFVKEMAGESVCTEFLRYDGYYLSVNEKRIIASGNYPRSALYAVYRLLEEAGCRWMFPGPAGEFLPETLAFSDCEIIDNPDYAVRATADDTAMSEIPDSYVREITEKFDWAAKNRLNTYFWSGVNIHNGNAFLSPLILRELNKRGTVIEIGGHNTPHYVDRALFETKPYLFREVNGERRPDGNFCTSCDEAVQMVIDGVGRMIEKMPGLGCFHLWFEDVFEGSWCSCEKCRHLTPTEQMMRVISAVAKAYPNLSVDFIMYHDSGDISSLSEELPKNISAYFAPRERCYAHCISDPSCLRNQKYYYSQLKLAAEKFNAVYPFEYYADMILFNKMASNMDRTIAEDMRAYHALGTRAMTLLMFAGYSAFAYKLPMSAYAACTWRIDTDHLQHRKEFCDTCFGKAADTMLGYYAREERFTDLMFEFCGYDNVHDIRNIEPVNREFGEKHLADLCEAEKLLSEMGELLEQAKQQADNARVRWLISSEQEALHITAVTASVTHRFMKARHELAFCGLDKAEFNAVMEEIIADNEELADYALALPDSLIGINGKTTFRNHLCGDINNFYRYLASAQNDG